MVLRTPLTNLGALSSSYFLVSDSNLLSSSNDKEFISDEAGNVKGAKTIKVDWYQDESGRLTFKEVEGSEEIIDVDIVMLAMGFLGTEEYISNSFDVKIDNRGNIDAEYKLFKTSREKIFTCGDARRGQSLVVWAIREGLEAAKSINEYLNSNIYYNFSQ